MMRAAATALTASVVLSLTPSPGHPPLARQAAPGGAATAVSRGPLDEALVNELLEKFRVPGVSIAVSHDFRIAWARGYGVADVETKAVVTPDTLFQAASISKPVAAMLSLRAVQDGRFGLDQDVNTILKSWRLPADPLMADRPVTPRGLMSHTSGTGDAFGFPGYAPGEAVPVVARMFDGQPPSNRRPVRLERVPLTAFEYSGGGVMIQQLALTDAVGEPFESLARERIFAPLGMANSTFEQPLPPARAARAARAHDRDGARMGAPWHVYPEQAAAGLWTTPTDLATFMIEVQTTLSTDAKVAANGERVLKRGTMLEMVTPVGVGPFAVGFSVQKEGEGWYFSHGGSNWGFRANVVAHRQRGYAMAIMTNGDRGGELIAELERILRQAYAWDSLDTPVPRGYGPGAPRD